MKSSVSPAWFDTQICRRKDSYPFVGLSELKKNTFREENSMNVEILFTSHLLLSKYQKTC